MSLRKRFFAATYDRMSRKNEEHGVRALREGLLADASGRVLEIGGGTGANLPFYDGAVESLVVTEPEPNMLSITTGFFKAAPILAGFTLDFTKSR